MSMMKWKAGISRRVLPALILIGLTACRPAFGEVPQKQIFVEKDYEDATLLLIDAQTGAIGVILHGETPAQDQKRSFLVDLKDVYVADAANQLMDFEELKAGDRIAFTTRSGSDGGEMVTDITYYGRTA